MKQLFIKILIFVFMIQTVVGCSSTTVTTGIRDIQASFIIEQLNEGKHVYLDSCIVWGDLDFTILNNRNPIASNLTQVFVERSITFTNCVFLGKVKAFDGTSGISVEFAHNLSFTGCDFRSEVDFSEVIVGGPAFFTGSKFRDMALFQGAHFRHKKVYFNEMLFEGDALFQNVIFAGEVNFLHTVFNASAMFQKVIAGGLMFFGDVRFDGYADFTYARAPESIFRYAKFNQRYDFGDSNINSDLSQ